ncbi:chemotaxis protein CheD [Alishewanella sp. SMS8]|uniref:chemotaxis protein CheD n=1 Tax=Alishewanella sp. SMS8 TaxID=2994676 RepID=UPI0027414AD3|nr:chemotaxis protein CheD [Alishewanella sp. SMS8]MDP5460379.1 chemotaxis protein CheD [Alishewanella sp. SMS8]
MNKNVFLKPGEWFFGKGQGKVSTILGSCVSVVLWHPEKHVLGVSHILLPNHQQSAMPLSCVKKSDLNGRFADDLMKIFQLEIALFGIKASEFKAYLIGGGNMFPHAQKAPGIGEKNIERCLSLLGALNIPVQSTDVGGPLYRRLTVDIASGHFSIEQSEVNRFELLFA